MVIGLGAGLLLGLAGAALADLGQPGLRDLLVRLRPLGRLFLNLLSMVVIPLVAAALFTGIARLGALRTLGRLVTRTLAFFWGTTLIAIAIGFAAAAVLVPAVPLGSEHQDVLRAASADTTLAQRAAAALPGGTRFLVELIPSNPLRAAVDFNLLPVIVFVSFLAVATASLPAEKRAALTDLADVATEALIRIVHWVLLLAPVGIFALVAPLVAIVGWQLIRATLGFIAAVVVGLALFVALVYLPLLATLARVPPGRFLRVALPSLLMGFSTTSSLATLPTMLQAADHGFKLPRAIAGFVLPFGASINRSGSALFQAAAVLFIARLYDVPLDTTGVLQAGAAVFLASLTVASVPSASILSLFPAFATTGLPLAGLSLLLGIDRIPDMFRTATNVAGHLAGAAVVSAVEGAETSQGDGVSAPASTPRRPGVSLRQDDSLRQRHARDDAETG
ncbi:MAG: dicarboxylate/amino acid:cation symporter [Gemmatimonadales bacterium]